MFLLRLIRLLLVSSFWSWMGESGLNRWWFCSNCWWMCWNFMLGRFVMMRGLVIVVGLV